MKSYTDIEQSKELAKILPFESADMGWYYSRNPNAARNQMWVGTKTENADIPCWSLAALIQVLPITIVDSWTDYCLMLDIKAKMPRYVKYGDVYHPEFPWDFKKQSLLDSIVESIFWLHKNNYLNGSNR
jgi:hypothetical protein